MAALTFLTFLPVLQNDFVNLDDYANLVDNPLYRGLGWTQLSWMFTTFHLGHYQPLSWVTLGLDYLIWGMNPTGYHLTSLLIHVANAVFFYFICRRLLVLALPISSDHTKLTLSAAFAALLFAIHPLRVESVAWATERRDVLSGLFILWAIYGYLRANSEPWSRRWIGVALVVQLLSLLSKAWAITFPAVLLIIDIYLLKRLEPNPQQWFSCASRRVLWEKVPFIVVAVPFALLALVAQQQTGALTLLESHNLGSRLVQALYGISFYLWKTLAPVNLFPVREIPTHFIREPLIITGGAATIILSIFLYLLRNRWPWACWLCMVVVVSPVLGIAQSGGQFVAERYSYLSCLSWAVLAGGVLSYSLRVSAQTRREKRRGERQRLTPSGLAAVATTTVILVLFASLTWKQTKVWQSTGVLFLHSVKVDPTAIGANYLYGQFLYDNGRHAEAIPRVRYVLSKWPDSANTRTLAGLHSFLGSSLAYLGYYDAALNEFQTAIELDPSRNEAFYNIGMVYAWQGELEKAGQNYEQALKLSPNSARYHAELAKALARQGQAEKAEAHFKKAIELNPNLPFCVLNFCQ